MRSLIGKFVPEPVRQVVRVNRALREHERLRPLWNEIDHSLTEGALVLNDVFDLLDRMPKNAVCAEIGVATGGLSKEIIRRTNPSKLYLVDPWDNDEIVDYSVVSLDRIKEFMKDRIASGQVEIRRGYSFVFLPEMPKNHLDWVYVDAAHDYDGVNKDLALCHRAVKPGGIIAGHDYVRWVSPSDRYGVVEAVNKFVNKTRSRLIYLTNQLDKHDSFAVVLNK